MRRVLVMANDSLLAEAITFILSSQADLDVVELPRQVGDTLNHSIREHNPEVIVVEQEEAGRDIPMDINSLSQVTHPLLVIVIPRKSASHHIYLVYEKKRDARFFTSYQLINPEMEQVINLVREFSRTYLRKKNEEVLAWAI